METFYTVTLWLIVPLLECAGPGIIRQALDQLPTGASSTIKKVDEVPSAIGLSRRFSTAQLPSRPLDTKRIQWLLNNVGTTSDSTGRFNLDQISRYYNLENYENLMNQPTSLQHYQTDPHSPHFQSSSINNHGILYDELQTLKNERFLDHHGGGHNEAPNYIYGHNSDSLAQLLQLNRSGFAFLGFLALLSILQGLFASFIVLLSTTTTEASDDETTTTTTLRPILCVVSCPTEFWDSASGIGKRSVDYIQKSDAVIPGLSISRNQASRHKDKDAEIQKWVNRLLIKIFPNLLAIFRVRQRILPVEHLYTQLCKVKMILMEEFPTSSFEDFWISFLGAIKKFWNEENEILEDKRLHCMET